MQQPSPQLFFDTVNSHVRTEALKAALELEVFTKIAEGNHTAADIGRASNASERGTRILCDYLCLMGFLTKNGDEYSLTPDTAFFLDKKSPAYLGGITEFLLTPELTAGFKKLAAAVKKGGTAVDEEGTVAPDNPIWVKFARAMAPMMAMPAQSMAQMFDPEANSKLKVLDIAAGHGLFGLAFATRNPQAEITAVDWAGVLEVAKENAARAGASDRYNTIPGSAFDVDFGNGYDLVLLTNFLHHFDPATNEQLLKKIHASLNDGGRVITLEFVPNDDRISPPESAGFSMIMLAGTPSGDAYTFKELDQMFKHAGYSQSEIRPLPPGIQKVIESRK
jgi:ubiquinone/menaquinone biosynthesis C-methylase UbiE